MKQLIDDVLYGFLLAGVAIGSRSARYRLKGYECVVGMNGFHLIFNVLSKCVISRWSIFMTGKSESVGAVAASVTVAVPLTRMEAWSVAMNCTGVGVPEGVTIILASRPAGVVKDDTSVGLPPVLSDRRSTRLSMALVADEGDNSLTVM